MVSYTYAGDCQRVSPEPRLCNMPLRPVYRLNGGIKHWPRVNGTLVFR